MTETLINYNEQEGEPLLAPQGWFNGANNVVSVMGDTGANSDTPTNANWNGNGQLRSLTAGLLGKNWNTFIVYPHVEVFRTGKCLVPGIRIDMELRLNPNTVYLMDFGANPGTNVPIVIYSECENVYEINNLRGIQCNIHS